MWLCSLVNSQAWPPAFEQFPKVIFIFFSEETCLQRAEINFSTMRFFPFINRKKEL